MDSRQYLSLGLAEELYGVPLRQVREIIRLPPITRLPGAPRFVRGVANLRGTVLPLMDLREALGLPDQPYGKYTVAVVTEAAGLPVGLIVDRVVDVLTLAEGEIDPPPPRLRADLRPEFVAGLAKVEGGLLVLLELDRILTDEEIGVLRSSSAA
jgi:purine-binding chemotaxis protein CheW